MAVASSLRVELDGLSVALRVDGDGPPVVLVHGGLADGGSWRHQVAALRERYRIYAPDLRGHGATRATDARPRYTSELLAHDLHRLVTALELERFALVGLSLGGLVAQEYGIRHPERLSALVLADTWVTTVSSPRVRRIGRLVSPLVVGGLWLLGTGPLARLSGAGMPPGREEDVAAMAAAVRGTRRGEVVRVWRGLAEHHTADRLAAVSAPTLVIVGERDRNRAPSELLARLVPGAELVVLPGAGHNTNLVAPEAFTGRSAASWTACMRRAARPPRRVRWGGGQILHSSVDARMQDLTPYSPPAQLGLARPRGHVDSESII